MKTIVKFLKHTDNEGNVDIFAYFPHEDYNNSLYGSSQKVCYSYEGQHSSCSVEYAQESELASYDEYKPLLDELISQGYNDLEIINQQIETIHYEKSYQVMLSKLMRLNTQFDAVNDEMDKWVESNKPKFM